MTIVAQELCTTLDAEPVTVAVTAEADGIIAAEVQAALGNTALRAITVVTGNVAYEPKAPNQGQPFANWAQSDLTYHRIIVPTRKGGEGGSFNAVIPSEYTTTHSTI